MELARFLDDQVKGVKKYNRIRKSINLPGRYCILIYQNHWRSLARNCHNSEKRSMTRETIDKSKPLVSIIVPVFNVRAYLEEALDSVIKQTYSNLEIIIIDDGSTDGSGEICDFYAQKDSRIQVMHQENRGLSSARNAGLDIMCGEYVAFLDPDDAYHIDYIKELLSVAFRDNADIAVCRYTTQKTEGQLSFNTKAQKETSLGTGIYNRRSALHALAESKIIWSVWNKLYHRRLWTHIRFQDGQIYEDVDATFRILDLCETICVIDDLLYLKRIRLGSITDTMTQKNLSDWMSSFSAYKSFIKDRTPREFSYEQLRTVHRSLFNGMLVLYIRSSEKNSRMGRTDLEQCRSQIIRMVDETEICRFGLRTWTGAA